MVLQPYGAANAFAKLAAALLGFGFITTQSFLVLVL
jgi:hypothetical protein